MQIIYIINIIGMRIASKQNHIYDYLIIGAGLSGLQSLEVLSKSTKNIIVLQSQKQDGGRVHTQTVTSLPGADKLKWIQQNYERLKNVYIQKGATWIEERHKSMLDICKRFGLKVREQNANGVNLYLYRQKSIDNKQLNKDPKIGPKLRQFVDRIDHLSRIYDKYVLTTPHIDKSRAKRMLTSFDLKFVSEYLEQNIQSEEARELVDNFLQHTECIACDQNSMHQVLTKNARSNDIGILKQFLGDYGHEASYLLNQGSFSIIQKFVQQIQKLRGQTRKNFIFYNEQVITIDNKRSDLCVVRTLNNKTNTVREFKCRKIICTIPLSVSRFLSFTNISQAKRLIFDNQLRTTCSKSFLITKKPFWRDFATGDGMFSSQYMVNMCHDISPPDLQCGIMVFFHSGKKFNDWESKFKSEQNEFEAKKKYIMDLTCKIFRVSQQNKKQYIDTALFYISTFMNNPHIRSGFQSCTSPGTFNNIIKIGDGIQSYYRDENNIVFIGSQYSQEFASYMQGAVRVAMQKCTKLIQESKEIKNAPSPKL